jgi:hypothetical protein
MQKLSSHSHNNKIFIIQIIYWEKISNYKHDNYRAGRIKDPFIDPV